MRIRQEVSLPYELTGGSHAVRECLAQVQRAAAEDRSVLVIAERGLNPESVARVVHATSGRAAAPFVPLHCDRDDLERVLLGGPPRRGSDDLETVASGSALLRAQEGVLFLAQAGEMAAAAQRRLSRILRDQEVRVGRHVSGTMLRVRVVAAVEGSGDGALREDLIRRLPVVIDIPPLRRRREDVAEIAAAMLAARSRQRRFTPAALTVLSALPWRRNIAELSGLVDRLAASGGDALIRQEDVLAEVQLDPAAPAPRASLRDARRQFEKEYIASVLREHAWQMREAARTLGIERANLYRKARQLGIPLRRQAPPVAEVVR